MKIKYLGTAAAEGFPALFCKCNSCKTAKQLGGKNIRTRSQALVDDKLLLDLPADSYHHYLTQGFDLPEVDNLLITHSHHDHFYPMELEMRCEPYCKEGIHTLNIYGNEKTRKSYTKVEEYEPRVAKYNKFNIMEPFRPYEIGDYVVVAILANHDKNEDCFNYIIQNKSDGKVLLYAHDTGFYHGESWEYLKVFRFDLVSVDCTTGLDDDGDNHMGFNDTVTFKQMFLDNNMADDNTQFVLSHFSHGGGLLHEELVAKGNMHGMIIAYDGLEVAV